MKEETAVKAKGWKEQWDDRIDALAKASGKDAGKIAEALTRVVGAPSEEALTLLKDEVNTKTGDLRRFLCDEEPHVPVAVLNQYLPILRGKATALPAVQGGTSLLSPRKFAEIDDKESLLAAIKVGGKLKVKQPACILLASRAGLADRFGLFDVPAKLVKIMKDVADKMDEPCTQEFIDLMKFLRRKRFADVLEEFGLDNSFVTNEMKEDLLSRVRGTLWKGLASFNNVLANWRRRSNETVGENAVLLLLSKKQDGSNGLPEGMLALPSADILYAAAEELNDVYNRTLSGIRFYTAVSLGTESTEIKKILENPEIPPTIRAGNKDEMLQLLGVKASAFDKQLERDLAEFTLGTLTLPDYKGQEDEANFLFWLINLGAQIRWEELLGSPPAKPSSSSPSTGSPRSLGTVNL